MQERARKANGGKNVGKSSPFDGMIASKHPASIATGPDAATSNMRPNSPTARGISTLGTKAPKFTGKLLGK
jgi:hypothetical protein